MCWGLPGNRLRSLAKSTPDNHQRRSVQGVGGGTDLVQKLCVTQEPGLSSGQRKEVGLEGLPVFSVSLSVLFVALRMRIESDDLRGNIT